MFQKDDLVLLRRMRYPKGKSLKLIPKWNGPFSIDCALPNNAFILKGISGKILKHPVNYDRLKKYHSKQPYITITDNAFDTAPEFHDLLKITCLMSNEFIDTNERKILHIIKSNGKDTLNHKRLGNQRQI